MQCFKILGEFPIVVVAPEGLNMGEYKKSVKNFEVKFVHPKWFSSVLQYNKLKLSIFFYDLFHDYEYLLTYELDAFVFKNELIEWCNKGYDYIGAPWFDGYHNAGESSRIVGVGNSGFSLRKISTMKKIIRGIVYEPKAAKKRVTYLKFILKYPFRILLNQFGENHTLQKNYNNHEDYFITEIATKKYSKIRIAPESDAIKFSFEVNPGILYKMNGNNLPMGCHAWWRYDFDFWKFHIKQFGYNV
jgi:hypothetical protein